MTLNKFWKILFVFVGLLLVVVLRMLSTATETCQYHAAAYRGLELTQLSQELENTGLIGRIHGAATPAQLFVMSVREPENFFNHREFSLLASDAATQTTLSQVNRHDLVCIQGNFIPNPSPQKHVAVKSIKVVEPWSGLEDFPAYEREAELPTELVNQTSFVGKVHAIAAGGQVLVVEYKDGVLPIFVESPEYSQGLYRGDIIRLAYQIQNRPQQPTHLQLDLAAEKPIEVMDAIANWHERPETLTGKLVKFPQSPQLKFDVYAIEVETQGIKRTFTLINFENPTEFQSIREKLARIWDSHQETATPGRNMLINPDVVIEASGRINVISPEQANPQILLDTAADIQLKPTGA
ncbi:MAG: hypothetical protein F6K19_44835 [Cyanothece sp. SIO1E1]|nr:hypothetical protein [Cyanothece sp. SIO1E1]